VAELTAKPQAAKRATIMFLFKEPSNDRDWSPDQAILPFAEIARDLVTIHNIRKCTYRSADDYDVAHYDRPFALSGLSSVDLIVEPFAVWRGPAHTFLSFGFEGLEYVAISAEIRKVRGQHYSPWRGLFRSYELMYVIGDERDLIQLRAIHRNDDVYLYPLRVTKEGARQLFLDMLRKTNQLRERPEFYNTLTNNCASCIVRHVNKVVRRKIPFSFRLLLPGYSDRLAHDLGWINTALPFAQARQRFRINENVRQAANAPDYSVRIRQPG
jgi:hypothetical protein